MIEYKKIWNGVWSEELDNPKVFGESEFSLKVAMMLKSKKKILGLGSGYGFDEMFLAKLGHQVTATDISDVAVARINQRAEENAINDRIIAKELSLLERFDFPDYCFDVVYSHYSLHYFDDNEMNHILSNVSRVLNIDGIFCMVARSSSDWKNTSQYEAKDIGPDLRMDTRGLKMRFYSKESLSNLFVNNNLKPIDIVETEIERYKRDDGYKEPTSVIIEAFAKKA